MDVGVQRYWNGSPALVSAALVDLQRGGQTSLSASQVAAPPATRDALNVVLLSTGRNRMNAQEEHPEPTTSLLTPPPVSYLDSPRVMFTAEHRCYFREFHDPEAPSDSPHLSTSLGPTYAAFTAAVIKMFGILILKVVPNLRKCYFS
ncbi:jg8916 [Pararge aegeria aegeria]|uniref:Jg8916 protein n=1 Tax=Pararge aegeria aegeria TaxID=348720 RepID=A0A8S4SDS1_9NEOP|nr:jg8916 [Pararge aegeria aegeria]